MHALLSRKIIALITLKTMYMQGKSTTRTMSKKSLQPPLPIYSIPGINKFGI